MSKSSPLIDDLLTLGGSLFGNLSEVRREFKTQAKGRAGSLIRNLDLVGRDEFDAAFAILAKARDMQEDLDERLARIEKKLGLSSAAQNKKPVKRPLPSIKQSKKRRA